MSTATYWYMILDVTTEVTKLLYVTDHRRAIYRGYLLKAEGKKAIAPPLEGRSFSKLDKLQLQYLYYQLKATTPPEDYDLLVAECFLAVKSFQVDTESLDNLAKEVGKIWTQISPNLPPPEGVVAEAAFVSRAEGEDKDEQRPSPKGATGKVWLIADEFFSKTGAIDRKGIIDACVAAGINQATANTQYAKWKKSKGI
jgi:hypothetical protein